MSDLGNRLLWHKFKFMQLTPVHIGKKNYGVLSETRLFIPGWTMWGALVNSYGKLNDERDEYFQKGQALFENITCFYPTLSNDEVMFPNFKKDKIYMGNISEKDFRMRFTDTYMSTAVEAPYFSAKDESLHEIEIILPRGKQDNDKALYWVGLIGVEKDKEEEFKRFINQLKEGEIYVGGELTYGFGKMKLVNDDVVDKNELNEWGIDETGKIVKDRKCFVKNYIEINNSYEFNKGDMEFVVIYNFSNDIPSIEAKGYYFIPGSEIQIDKKINNLILKKGIYFLKQ